MATLKLNLNKNRPAGPARPDAERRGPLRGKGVSRPRQTLEKAQGDRQERQAQYEQRSAEHSGRPAHADSRDSRDSRGPRSPQQGGYPGQRDQTGPRQDERRPSFDAQRGNRSNEQGYQGQRDQSGPRHDERRPAFHQQRDGRPNQQGAGEFRGRSHDQGGYQGQRDQAGPRHDRPAFDPQRGGRPAQQGSGEFRGRGHDQGGYQGQRDQSGPRHDRPGFDPQRGGFSRPQEQGSRDQGGGYQGQRNEAPRFDDRRPRQDQARPFEQRSQDSRGPNNWDQRPRHDERRPGGYPPRGGAPESGYAQRQQGYPGQNEQREQRPRFDGPGQFDRPQQVQQDNREPGRDQRQDQRRNNGPRPALSYMQRQAQARAQSQGQAAPRRQVDDDDDDEDYVDPAREGVRLSKQMGLLGMASRREADEWIAAGWVRVDGKLAVLGQRVGPDVKIEVDQLANKEQAKRVTILINKPIGLVSGQAEDGYENASTLIRSDTHWADDTSGIKYHIGHSRGLAPAGRLDIDSTGLLVLTQDGRIAKLLIGEDSKIEKEYLVRVEYEGRDGIKSEDGRLPEADLALLNHGLMLDDVQLKPAKVSWQNEDQLRFVLREGRKRQIRRMCEQVGLKVVGLRRVRIGRISLGNLPVGQWRFLTPWERFD